MPRGARSLAVLTGALLAGLSCRHVPPPETPLDATLERSIDVTGDGEPDRVVLYLEAISSHAPVHWLLEIEARGRIVFRYQSDDAALDSFFAEPGAVGNCKTYLECKRRYYLESILGGIVAPGPSDPDDPMFDPSGGASIHTVARDFLVEECGKSEAAAERIVKAMIERLQSGKGLLLNVPKSPIESLPPMMYVEDVGRFVPVYGG